MQVNIEKLMFYHLELYPNDACLAFIIPQSDGHFNQLFIYSNSFQMPKSSALQALKQYRGVDKVTLLSGQPDAWNFIQNTFQKYQVFTWLFDKTNKRPLNGNGRRFQKRFNTLLSSTGYCYELSRLNARYGRPVAFNTQCAYAGLDILPKIPVKPKSNVLSQTELTTVALYCAQRAISYYRLFQTPYYHDVYAIRSEIIQRYRLHATPMSTDAQISSLMLTDNSKIKYQDLDSIDYHYPVNGQKADLLEYLKRQNIIPARIEEFYQRLRGKTKQQADQILDGKTTITIPYYRNQQPTDSYVTLSIGGAHGSLATNTLNIPFFDKSNGEVSINKQTVLYRDAYSIDIRSCYPTLLLNLNVFGERYRQVLNEKLSLERQRHQDAKSSLTIASLKLILNSATGKAAARSAISVPNKITSMRIIGNLLIYYLGSQFVQQCHAKVLMTNTDGIIIGSDDKLVEEQIKQIAHDFGERFNVQCKVRHIPQVMVKDTNNIIEWDVHPELKPILATGKLGKGYRGTIPLTGAMDHPPVVDMAVIEFLTRYAGEIMTDDDKKGRLLDILIGFLNPHQFDPLQWCVVARKTAHQCLFLNQNAVDNVLRCVLSTRDGNIVQIQNGTHITAPKGWPSSRVEILNSRRALQNFTGQSLDLDAYVEWCMQVLNLWHIKQQRPSVSLFNVEDEPDKDPVDDLTARFDSLIGKRTVTQKDSASVVEPANRLVYHSVAPPVDDMSQFEKSGRLALFKRQRKKGLE